MKTAKMVKQLDGWSGEAKLYELNEPLIEKHWKNKKIIKHFFVIVSAANTPDHGPETFIFPSNKNGKPKNLCELDGSFVGEMDHSQALINAGYKIIG